MIDIDPGDLTEDTTISVTQTVFNDPEVDLTLGPNPGLGQAIAVYDLEPDGLVFDSPVTLTMIADVTALNTNQRSKIDLYIFDEMLGAFVSLDAVCIVTEDPVGVFIVECTAEVSHFSTFSIVTPQDSDGDGVLDLFPPESDKCPNSDLSSTVVVDACDSGVTNTLLADGCTISDLIGELGTGAENHGKFVSSVAKLLNQFKKDGVISGSEKDAIQTCVAEADIP